MAREALSSGDKIPSENYLQHADHFSRILSIQEINKVENTSNNVIEQDFKRSRTSDADNKIKETNLI